MAFTQPMALPQVSACLGVLTQPVALSQPTALTLLFQPMASMRPVALPGAQLHQPVTLTQSAASSMPAVGCDPWGQPSAEIGVTGQHPHAPAMVGVPVGEGMQPVPMKIAEKIWAWEFVDMVDLLPEQ